MTNKHEQIAKLIPFTVKQVKNKVQEIPYGLRTLEAPKMWEKGYDGDGQVVAILDTGCQPDHPNLRNNIIDGKNFTDEGSANDYRDHNGHGTHVAGTVAAHAEETGIHGVAPGAKLLIGKVLDGNGSGRYSWIINGIRYAINWRGPNNERVRVINMSLGGSTDLPELKEAIVDAVNNDIAVVCASGNEGDRNDQTHELAYPGAYNEVVEVGAVDNLDEIAYFSNENLEIDCVAPGVDIISTYPGGRYANLSGTSMATPHVSGALAILAQMNDKEFRRTITEAELYAQLIKNTISLGYLKSTEGNGLVKFGVLDKVKSLIDFVNKNF